MKKIACFVIGLALFASCSNDAGETAGKFVNASFTAQLDNGHGTRGGAINNGSAIGVSRCVLQIYMGDLVYKTITLTEKDQDGNFSFNNVALMSDQTYDFLFWADSGDKYFDVQSLKEVKLKSLSFGNDDCVDAFCNQPEDSLDTAQKLLGQRVTGSFSKNVVLRRPLSQLNVFTTDLTEIECLDNAASLLPDTVGMSVKSCTEFNVYANNTVGDESTLQFSGLSVYDIQNGHLTMNFLFAKDGSSVSEVTLQSKAKAGVAIVQNFTNIPFKRNWRTNIRGALLTEKGNFNVVIDRNWLGDIDINR